GDRVHRRAVGGVHRADRAQGDDEAGLVLQLSDDGDGDDVAAAYGAREFQIDVLQGRARAGGRADRAGDAVDGGRELAAADGGTCERFGEQGGDRDETAGGDDRVEGRGRGVDADATGRRRRDS